MTFIASVVAKEGIAVVSDSFVSTSEYSLLDRDLIKHLASSKNKKYISISDVYSLFEPRTSSTRNYVDKLFKFDDFSAITTTGAAYINDKEINDILKSISATMQLDEAAYKAKSIEDKLNEFIALLKTEVIGQSKKRNFSGTRFLFSHYNVQENKPQIFVIAIKSFKKDSFDETDPDTITYEERTHLKIVSAGQDTFADRLIFGSFYTNVSSIKPDIVEKVNKILKPKKSKKKS